MDFGDRKYAQLYFADHSCFYLLVLKKITLRSHFSYLWFQCLQAFTTPLRLRRIQGKTSPLHFPKQTILFRTVFEKELFHCTGVCIWHPKLSFTHSILRPFRFLFMGLDENLSVQNKSGYSRQSACSQNGCYRRHKRKSRCSQTSNTPCLHRSCKLHGS